MKILYLGDDQPHTTAYHRCQALRRLGHEVVQINPENILNRGRLSSAFHYRTGFAYAAWVARKFVLSKLTASYFDVGWVDCGHVVSIRLLQELRQRCRLLVSYSIDDPTGSRDGNKWGTFLKTIPWYDLMVVVRQSNVAEFQKHGALRVMRVFMGYDPIVQAPLALGKEELKQWAAEVAFVGTWMPERGPFLLRLLELGVPLTIRGEGWHKAREWPRIRAIVRPAPYGRDYVAAIQCAKVCLGLVSKGNRDFHTGRSSEIPFIGSVFCAERTTEHTAMYIEDIEALFWSSPEECALKCCGLLPDFRKRSAIAQAGHLRVIKSGRSNDAIVHQILESLPRSS